MVFPSDGRWSNYFMSHGQGFSSFWDDYLKETKRNLLFVVGRGFDPRMCHVIRLIFQKGGEGSRDCVALEYQDTEPKYHGDLLEENWHKLNQLVNEKGGRLFEKEVPMLSESRRGYESFSAAYVFDSLDKLSDYTDIIVDVSAMPRSIYFPLLHKLLVLISNAIQKKELCPNLHIAVSEDQKLDSCIIDEGLEENANYLHTFGAIDREANREIPKVWIPILGESQQVQLERIRNFLDPDEVCPLLPFPSRHPRRSDDLIAEYRRFLFDEMSIEPHNIIYADERNPFQVYREIMHTINHYSEVMKIIGGCKVIISPISSKLLSIGALLAAYESRQQNKLVGIAHVGCQTYRIEGDLEVAKSEERCVPYEIWLAGECYGS